MERKRPQRASLGVQGLRNCVLMQVTGGPLVWKVPDATGQLSPQAAATATGDFSTVRRRRTATSEDPHQLPRAEAGAQPRRLGTLKDTLKIKITLKLLIK